MDSQQEASGGLPICLIVFSLPTPTRPLVLVANRDEFHGRPADPMGWWEDRPILAGRDLQAGGTWLGVSATGRIAAVTNFREVPGAPRPRSRGELPLLALASDDPWEELPQLVAGAGADFGAFNLLVVDGDRALSLSNRSPGQREPTSGVHAVSNGPLDAEWPKTRRSRALLEAALRDGDPSEEALLAIARDECRPHDAALPDTGIGQEVERFLAPCFIRGDRYGTRATTLLWRSTGALRVIEHRHGPDGKSEGRSVFAWTVDD